MLQFMPTVFAKTTVISSIINTITSSTIIAALVKDLVKVRYVFPQKYSFSS